MYTHPPHVGRGAESYIETDGTRPATFPEFSLAQDSDLVWPSFSPPVSDSRSQDFQFVLKGKRTASGCITMEVVLATIWVRHSADNPCEALCNTTRSPGSLQRSGCLSSSAVHTTSHHPRPPAPLPIPTAISPPPIPAAPSHFGSDTL